MPEYTEILILFGVGLIAGTLNVMAGGGSSLTLPALIFLGLDGATANGTNRVAILIQNIFATVSFHKEKISNVNLSLKLALFTLPGAVLGAMAAVRISNEWFERVLAIVMIGVIVSMFLPKTQGKETSNNGRNTWLIYPIMFGIGFYGGFIQVGVGVINIASLYHVMRINLVFVNTHQVYIVLIYTIPSLPIVMPMS